MIKTIKPYGGINESLIHYIFFNDNGFFLKDKMGVWQIEPTTYDKLKERGFKDYGKCPPTQSF